MIHIRSVFILLTFLFGMTAVPLTAVSAQTPTPDAPTPIPDPPTFDDERFGVVESYENPDMASFLGAGWTRIRFQWAEVQADGPDSWTSRVSDAQIERELADGRMVVGLLIGVPDWARDENKLPQGLWLDYNDPDNTWANFVREAVTRYDGRITHWVIWNEPDIDADAIAHTWDGDVADFAQLQRVAYLAAKEANPDAVIHLSAFTYWADVNAGREQYMARLLDEIAQDPAAAAHNYYFDIATAHLYFQPTQIHDLLLFFTDIMRQRGLTHPIWLVETNAPPMDDPNWPVPDPTLRVTLYEQAAFMPQALGAALVAGAERIAVYKMQDTPDDRAANPEPFGLLRRDNSRRPAFDTYKVAIERVSGTVHAERERWDAVGQIRLDQPGQTTTILFARLPAAQQAQVTAVAPTAVLIDMWGEKEVATPVDGVYTIDLPASSCSHPIGDYCMIGGTTYYLVQAGENPTPTPTATVTPTAVPPTATPTLPPPTATPTPTAVPTVTETPPPTVTATPPPAVVTATAVPSPPPAEPAANLSLWLIGGGVLLGVLLGGWWWLTRRT